MRQQGRVLRHGDGCYQTTPSRNRVLAWKAGLNFPILAVIPVVAAAQQPPVSAPSASGDEDDVTLIPQNPEDDAPLEPFLPLNDAPDNLTTSALETSPEELEDAAKHAEEAQQASLDAASVEKNPSLPEPVLAMIEAALESENEDTVRAVLELARKTNPGSEDEIETIRLAYEDRLAAEETEREAAKIEAVRTAGILENWDGRGEIGGFQSTGNANVVGITAALALTKTGYNWRHRFNGRVDYQETNNVVRREQYLATYEPNRKLTDRIFVFGFGQYERDQFQGFAQRYTLSSGLRYELVDDGAVTLSAKAGPAWRSTNFIDGTNLNEIAALGAFDVSWKITENLTLTNNSNVILQSSNSTLVSQSGAIAKISGKLSVRLSHTIEYNTQPPVGSVTTDMLSRITLIYDF